MEQPTPRVALGLALRGIAHAAADISDGLLGDLGHVLKASKVGAVIDTQQVASTLACTSDPQTPIQLTLASQLALTLSGGDDYELVFTASPDQREAVVSASQASQTKLTRIGRVTASPDLVLRAADGQVLPTSSRHETLFWLHGSTPCALDCIGIWIRTVAQGARHSRHFVGMGQLVAFSPTPHTR
jgi:thiamine-monophosphate kinase